MRLPAIGMPKATLLACWLAALPVAVHPAGERLDIAVAKYSGRDEHFQLFRASLKDWMIAQADELSSAYPDVKYLARLRLIDKNQNAFPSAADLERYWKESDVLQIFEGRISAEASNQYFVQSRIYLGELRGELPQRSILIEAPFAIREYADTRDSHVAVLFYALAMDAERVDPRRRVLIASLLKVSKDKLRDVSGRNNGRLTQELLRLQGAVDKAEARLRQR